MNEVKVEVRVEIGTRQSRRFGMSGMDAVGWQAGLASWTVVGSIVGGVWLRG